MSWTCVWFPSVQGITVSRKKPRHKKSQSPQVLRTPAQCTHVAAQDTPVVRPPLVDRAMRLAARLDDSQLRLLEKPLRDALTALEDCVFEEHHWYDLDGACALAGQIERQGIVRGLVDDIQRTREILTALKAAATAGVAAWTLPPVDPLSKKDLDTFVHLHLFQLRNLSLNEFRAVFLKTAQNHLPGALAAFHGKGSTH